MNAQSLRETLTSALDFIQSGEQMGSGVGNLGQVTRVGDGLGGAHSDMVARRAAWAPAETHPDGRSEATGERRPV